MRTLYERPTQLRRFPDGIEGEAIYQKRVPEKRPEWVDTARVTFPSGRHADELCVTELAQVIWAANLAVVDFHPWPSRRRDTEHPDELRIDIDPQPGTTFEDGKKVAAVVREVLGEIGFVGRPKTSGNRGIHVFCRIEPNWEFPVVRRAALAFAREVERRAPKKITTAWWKEQRGKRVFIDFNQNARDRTVASAYSVRARDDAAVSAPVTWDDSGRRDRGLHDDDDAAALRRAGRHPGRHERRRLRPPRPPRVGRARREGGRRRGRLPAELPEDAGGAAARAAFAGAEAELIGASNARELAARRRRSGTRLCDHHRARMVGKRDVRRADFVGELLDRALDPWRMTRVVVGHEQVPGRRESFVKPGCRGVRRRVEADVDVHECESLLLEAYCGVWKAAHSQEHVLGMRHATSTRSGEPAGISYGSMGKPTLRSAS